MMDLEGFFLCLYIKQSDYIRWLIADNGGGGGGRENPANRKLCYDKTIEGVCNLNKKQLFHIKFFCHTYSRHRL